MGLEEKLKEIVKAVFKEEFSKEAENLKESILSEIRENAISGTDNLLTVADVEKKLKISQVSIRRKLKAAILKGSKFGGEWRVKESDLEDYILRCEKGLK